MPNIWLLNKRWYIHTMEYHAITKKNEIGQYVLTEEVRTYI